MLQHMGGGATSKHTDLDPETDLFSCQTRGGHGSVKRARTDPGAKACNELHTQSKHTPSGQTCSAQSPDTTLYIYIQAVRINTTHSAAHADLAT